MTLPTSWTTVPVFGTYLRTDGTANQGAVWFEVDQSVQLLDDTGTPIAVLPKRIVAELDASGTFHVDLPSTDDPSITPTGWTYRVTEKFAGGQVPYSIEVPQALASTGINLVQYPHATPVPVDPPVVTYLTTADLGVTVGTQGDVASAVSQAASAVTTAAGAVTTANNALAVANSATSTANNALTVANGVDAKATTALANSTAAVTTANNALAVANSKLDLHGTADASLKWATPRTLTLDGDASGDVALDGTADVTLSVVVSHALAADTATTSGSASTANQADQWTTARTITLSGDATGAVTLDGTADEGMAVTVSHAAAADTATTASTATTATSAGKWTTARTLSFTGDTTGSGSIDGSGNVSIALTTSHATSADSATTATSATSATTATSAAKWTTARTLTLSGDITGSASIDGSGDVTLTTTSVGGAGGWKNFLINPDFEIWQRGTNFNPVGPGVSKYTADRWKYENSGEGGQVTRGTTASFLTPITDAPNQYLQALLNSITAGSANYSIVEQKIPGLRKFSGKTVTLSFWAAASVARPISAELIGDYGTGGSPTSQVTGLGVLKTANLSATTTKFTTTVTLPTFSGTYGTNGDDSLHVRFWFSAGSSYDSRTGTLGQASNGNIFVITRVQLEAGSHATAADLRPTALELEMCQRFYEKSYDLATTPVVSNTGTAQRELGLATSTTSITTPRRFKVRKRVAPTVTLYASADGSSGAGSNYAYSTDASTWSNGTSAAAQVNETGFNVTITGSSLTAGAAYLTSGQWEADAELP